MPNEEKKEQRFRSWFCVLNNPEKNISELANSTPEEICKFLSGVWCTSEKRSGAWVYCISAEGLQHVHMVLECENKASFSAIKKAYPFAHIEPTQGNKSQVEDYINKRGKFEEKGEKVLYTHVVGEIKGKQGKRTDLEEIKNLVDSGLTPIQILDSNPNYYRVLGHIEKMYYNKKLADTPVIRDNIVYWHFGGTGTGKTFQGFKNMQDEGRENIFITSAENSHPFDRYTAQKEIWIDELRQDSEYFSFARLLGVCDKYTADVSARYSDCLMLWTSTHITSPMLPQEVYDNLRNKQDKLAQLLRRIKYYVYHERYNGEFKAFYFNTNNSVVPMDRNILINLAHAQWDSEIKKESSEMPSEDSKDFLSEFVPLGTNS